MPHPLHVVDVFAETRWAGNPLSVVLDAGDLSGDQMQAIFVDHPLDSEEILPLVAYLSELAVAPPESGQAATLIFTLLGLAGTAAALVLFDAVWRKRFRAVRRMGGWISMSMAARCALRVSEPARPRR